MLFNQKYIPFLLLFLLFCFISCSDQKRDEIKNKVKNIIERFYPQKNANSPHQQQSERYVEENRNELYHNQQQQIPEKQPLQQEPQDIPQPPVPKLITAPVRASNGILKKFIIKGTDDGEDAPVRKEPNENASIEHYIKPLKFVYLFHVPNHKDQIAVGNFYYISKTPLENDILGWIDKKCVIEWDHRECLNFTPQTGVRKPVKVYANIEAVQNELDSKSPGENPISQEPVYKPNAAYEMLLPVLDKKIYNVNGEKIDLYEIAYIHAPRLTHPLKKRKKVQQNTNDEKFNLDIVFVIDATKDMRDYIKIVRNVITKLAFDTTTFREDVRYGLVIYRDRLTVPEMNKIMGSPVKWCLKLNDNNYADFIKVLNEIRVADISSEDIPEAVLDGLFFAIEHEDWKKNALKMVILIGNASGHDSPDGLKNPHSLTLEDIVYNKAAARGIRISAFRLPGASKTDESKFEKQLSKLITGSGPATKGEYCTLDKGFSSFLKKIEELLRKEAKRLDLVQTIIRNENQSNASEQTDQIVLWNLQASREGETANMKKSFSKGWISSKIDGKPTVTTHALISKDELEIVNILLRGIRSRVEGSGHEAFLNVITPCIKQLTGNFEETSFDVLLQKTYGLPVRSNLMKMTPNDFVNLEQYKKESILKSVREKLSILDNFSNHYDWIGIGNHYCIGFLPVLYLP